MWRDDLRDRTGVPSAGAEVDEELEFHLVMRAEELEQEGLSPQAARRRAEAEFGDVEGTRRYCRRQDGFRRRKRKMGDSLRMVRGELTLSVRALARRPGAILAPLMILAVAVALNALVLSVVRGVLVSPLPVQAEDRVAVVEEVQDGGGFVRASYPVLTAWGREARQVEVLSGYLQSRLPLLSGSGPIYVDGASVVSGFFQLFDDPFRAGRAFNSTEHSPGGPPVVAISESLWRRAFGSQPEILGQLLDLNGEDHEVVAVVRDAATFPDGAEFWVPVEREAPQILEVAGAKIIVGLARLRPGVTLDAVGRELAEISARIPGGAPDAAAVWLRDRLLGDVRTPLVLLQGAVLLVLLAAAANAGSLLLARGVRRRGEVALRTSLGAGSARVAFGLLTEGALLGASAGLVGLLLARIALGPALALVPINLPRASHIALDPGVALLALVLATATGIATALVPTLTGLRAAPSEVLRESDRGSGTPPWIRRALDGFVVTQVALALVLTAGAGLLIRSFISTVREDPGFRSHGVTLVDLALPEYRYPDEASRMGFAREILEGASTLSGVEAVALGRNLPISGTNMTSPLMVDGSTGQTGSVQMAWVTPGYFDVLGIPISEGRGFRTSDGPDGPPVMMVDPGVRTAEGAPVSVGARAHSFFGGQEFRQVIGIAGAVRHRSLRASPVPMVYEPFFQGGGAQGFTLMVRSAAPAGLVAGEARQMIQSLDPELPVDQVTTMDARISRSLAEPRFFTLGLSIFGAVAILLALAGCQAGLAHRVASRRREIGIRVALGAAAPSVRAMILRRGLVLTTLGVLIGLTVAIPGTHLLESQLYGVTSTDPVTYGVLLLLILGAGALASDLPARRAAALDPAEVLREG